MAPPAAFTLGVDGFGGIGICLNKCCPCRFVRYEHASFAGNRELFNLCGTVFKRPLIEPGGRPSQSKQMLIL